uniref:Uncharacterized protein n=1 Tax=Arundo donax TaxID=35708 RepID=A0A0A9AH50_ARUDO
MRVCDFHLSYLLVAAGTIIFNS